MEGLVGAASEDDTAADGSGGGGEEIRRCNAPRAARPPIARCQRSGVTLTIVPGAGVGGGAGGHNRKKKQQQRQQQQQHQQQQQQQQQQHGGGKNQKKQQKWKGNKYRGGRGGCDRKDGAARGRKDNQSGAVGKGEEILSNNGVTIGEDAGLSGAGGANVMAASSDHQNSEPPGSFHQLHHGTSQINPQSSLLCSNAQQQSSHPAQQTSSAPSQQGHGGPTSSSVVPSQKGKHSKQQNLSPMGLRNKRLQSVSKYFLPDKRPRKDCIVPPTKFLLGGNISDPLNLNSLQNESENAVTPKSSPIPTPPHYKAKIEVIIPPNINDPLHLLDPVDSVEYEMQLCSPMKRKQRTRNKRKRKARTTTERNVDGPMLLAAGQLPPPSGAVVDGAGTGMGEAATAEEASFTGIGQKFAEAAGDQYSQQVDSFPFSEFSAIHLPHLPQQQPGGGGAGAGLLLLQSHFSANAGAAGSSSSGSVVVVSCGPAATGAVALPEQDREREKAMRNLKLDLESAGGRKRRTSESTNSTKNKLRRIDSMDKIVSPVIPQPGGWKRAHWPANAGGSGAAGSAGRNRTRTFSTASNNDEQQHGGDEGAPVERCGDAQAQDNRQPSGERSDTVAVCPAVALKTLGSSLELNSKQLKPEGKTELLQQGDAGRLIVHPVATRPEIEPAAGTVSAIPRPLTALAASSRYHYGNYDRYYGYHSLNEFIDVRLKVFLRNPYLFRDKDVLDIGCNVGLMTIAVAKALHTKTTTGIDVDGKLIAKARKNLANYVRLPRKVPAVEGGRKGIAAASCTVTSARQQEHKKEVKIEATPVDSSVASESSQQPCLAVEVSVAGRIDGGESATDSQVLDEISIATSNTADPLPIVPALGRVGVQECEAEPQDRTLQEAAQHEQQLLDKQAESKAMVLKHSALVQRLRQKHRRKHCGGKSHGRSHQQHHTHHHLRQGGQQTSGCGRVKAEYAQYFPISFPLTMGNFSGKEYQMDIGRPANKFPHNVRFKTMNYVVKDESFINYDTQQYDLILCLSVTKWIHLNYGDTGLKIAFKRMFNHLRPGGKLILEAQNWASYKKKKKLTETVFENYKNIDFFPNRFHDYLLSPEVGFSHSYPLGIPRHLSKGFRRPIQLYIKGDFTPSQAKWSDTYHPGTPYENHRGIYTDIVTTSQTTANCIWGAMTPYAPSYSYRQPPTPSHVAGGSGGGSGGSGGGSGGFASTSPYYNPRQTDSYLPSYDNIGNGHRPGSYCFASPLYSTTWSPPSDMLATSGGGGGSYRRSASNTPNSASIRSTDNDEHYYAGAAGGGSQRRHHVYPPIDVFPPMLGHDHMRSSGSFRSGGGALTDSDSEPSSNSASQTPTRQQQFLTDDQSNSPSGHSQPDK